jgi:hypothetical protein
MPGETSPPNNHNSRSGAAQVRTVIGSLFNLFTGQGARQGYLAAIDQAVISLSNFARSSWPEMSTRPSWGFMAWDS